MNAIALDTPVARKLQASGFTQKQAETQAEILGDMSENTLETRDYLDVRLADLRCDLLKWLIPLLLGQAGVTALLVKLIV